MASRSLGTLTLDLIAKVGGFQQGMDKASRSAESSMKRIQDTAKNTGAVVTSVLGAAVGAVALEWVAQGAKASAEIARFANVANTSAETFQKLAFGAEAAGISSEKLSDIFKDVNDKVGDFLQNGSGEMKDFFTNIAPLVGVTANQFKNLSGPQALQLYYSSLEKANLSQADMTFYMESVADEATALIPLLKNGGQGFKEFGDTAERLGLIMSGDTLKASQDLNTALFVMDKTGEGLRNQIGAALAPTIVDFANILLDTASKGDLATEMADTLSGAFKGLLATGSGVYATFQLVGTAIGGVAAAAAMAADGEFTQAKDTLSNLMSDLDDVAQKSADRINKIMEAGTKAANNNASDRVQKLAGILNAGGITGGIGGRGGDQGKAAEKASAKAVEDAGQKRLDNLRQQNAALQAQYDSIDAQTGKVVTLGQQAQALAKWEQELATLKEKKTLTAEQKSVLASADLLTAQYKRNAALEKEVDLRKKAAEEAAKLKAFQDNLNNQLDTTRQDQAGSIATIGMGSEQAQRFQEMLSIRQQFEQQQNDLLGQYNSGDISKDLYDEETEALSDALQTRLELQQDYYRQLDDAQSDWRNGASEAFADYFDQSTNVAAMSYDAFSTAFSGMNDALYDFVTTGKLSFSDLAGEFASTALRMLIQWGTAQVAMAALNAFTSTAAIPIVGPLAAPAAAASALGSAGSFMGMISSVAGMAHDGIDSVPEDGTWLLQKGERVTTAETSAKLDKTLSDIQGSRSGHGDVQVINNGQPVSARTQMDGNTLKIILDAVEQDYVGKMTSGTGRYPKAVESSYGVQRRGR